MRLIGVARSNDETYCIALGCTVTGRPSAIARVVHEVIATQHATGNDLHGVGSSFF